MKIKYYGVWDSDDIFPRPPDLPYMEVIIKAKTLEGAKRVYVRRGSRITGFSNFVDCTRQVNMTKKLLEHS